jgi:subtilisin-like proprotein convertase family protein
MPGTPAGFYSTSLDDLVGTNPNGTWKLYIYDDHSGTVGVGKLKHSWQLNFFFQ